MMLAFGQVCYECSKAGTSPLWCSFGVTWRHTAARAAMGAEAEAEAEAGGCPEPAEMAILHHVIVLNHVFMRHFECE